MVLQQTKNFRYVLKDYQVDIIDEDYKQKSQSELATDEKATNSKITILENEMQNVIDIGDEINVNIPTSKKNSKTSKKPQQSKKSDTTQVIELEEEETDTKEKKRKPTYKKPRTSKTATTSQTNTIVLEVDELKRLIKGK